jgi:hypothetical protein
MEHDFRPSREPSISMSDNVVALFAIFFIFGLPVVAWIVVRTFRFLERIEMIKHGIVPPPDSPFGFRARREWREWARGQQQQQMGWQPGSGPMPGPGANSCWEPGADPQRMLFKGIRLAAIGLALFIGLSFIGGTPGTPGFTYGPWLLGGLIPLFVGIAQIAISVLCGAQLPQGRRTFVDRSTFVAPPPPPGPDVVPPPSGAWQQPGRRLEELGKPTPPPDVR